MRAVVLHSRLSSSFPRLLPKKDNPRTNFFAVCALLITATQIPHRRNFISMSQFPLVHVPCVSPSLSPCLIHDPSNQLPPRLALTFDLDENQDCCFPSPQFNFQGPERQSRATLSLM